MLRGLTVDTAAQYLKTGRDYLRTGNGGRPHRHIHFRMPTELATAWRRELIRRLEKTVTISFIQTGCKNPFSSVGLPCDLLRAFDSGGYMSTLACI